MVALTDAMRGRSTADLRLVCTRDAGDYTLEALEAARAELVRRGEDVRALVPAAPREKAEPRVQNLVARIVVLVLFVPLIAYGTGLPPWLHIAAWVVMGACVLFLLADGWRRNALSDRKDPPSG